MRQVLGTFQYGWRRFNERFEFFTNVLSSGILYRRVTRDNWAHFDGFLVDFRNPIEILASHVVPLSPLYGAGRIFLVDYRYQRRRFSAFKGDEFHLSTLSVTDLLRD
jgi:hypothetical protein